MSVAAYAAGLVAAAAALAPAGALAAEPWPGGSAVSIVDGSISFGEDLSGLYLEAGPTIRESTLWAVRNEGGTLFKLRRQGAVWTQSGGASWSLGYPAGTAGGADSEGVTLTDTGSAGGVYVASERSNGSRNVSRLSVLRYDVTRSTAGSLQATHEWNLTGDLPGVDPNKGLESIAWVPDDHLVAARFRDERVGRAYKPSDFPDHGGGLFFVGLESGGTIYAYALDQSGGGFTRIASFPAAASGFGTLMDLQWDGERGLLWAVCDDHCGSRVATYEIATGGANAGRFVATHVFDPTSGLPGGNTEGFTFAPESTCVNGRKLAWFADDAATGGHALREGTLDCLPPEPEPEPEPEPDPDPDPEPGPDPEPWPAPELEPWPAPEPERPADPATPIVVPVLPPTPTPEQVPPRGPQAAPPDRPKPAARSLRVRPSASVEAVGGRRLLLRMAAKGVPRARLNQTVTLRVSGASAAFSVRLRQGRATVGLPGGSALKLRSGARVSVTVTSPAFAVRSGTTTYRAVRTTTTVVL